MTTYRDPGRTLAYGDEDEDEPRPDATALERRPPQGMRVRQPEFTPSFDAFQRNGGDMQRVATGKSALGRREDPDAQALAGLSRDDRLKVLVTAGYPRDVAEDIAWEIQNTYFRQPSPIETAARKVWDAPQIIGDLIVGSGRLSAKAIQEEGFWNARIEGGNPIERARLAYQEGQRAPQWQRTVAQLGVGLAIPATPAEQLAARAAGAVIGRAVSPLAPLVRRRPLIAGASDAMQSIAPPASNPLGFQPVPYVLSRGQRVKNVFTGKIPDLIQEHTPLDISAARGRIGVVPDHPVSRPLTDEKLRLGRTAESLSNRLAAKAQARIADAFEVDRDGTIKALAGVDPGVQGAPHLQTVAARLPNYEHALTQEQIAIIKDLSGEVEQYRQMMKELGIEVGTRADIQPGGYYLPRGAAELDGFDPVKVRGGGRGGGKAGLEKPAIFPTMEEAAARGYRYDPAFQASGEYVHDASRRSIDAWYTRSMTTAVDAQGRLLSSTAGTRMDAGLRYRYQALRSSIRNRAETLRGMNKQVNQQIRATDRTAGRAGAAGDRLEGAQVRAEAEFAKHVKAARTPSAPDAH